MFSNNADRKMEFGLLDCRQYGECNGVGFVNISKIFARQDAIYLGTESVQSSTKV